MIIIKCPLPVPGESQAAPLRCLMRHADWAGDDGAVSPFNEAYLLALRVQSGGGLVQEQDLGVADDGPGDGNTLLLAARQLRTLGADVRVVFLRQDRTSTLKDLNITVSQAPVWTATSCLEASASLSCSTFCAGL